MESPIPLDEHGAQAQSIHALPITGLAIPEIELEAGLEADQYPSCYRFASIYGKEAVNAADSTHQALFQSLAIICSFHPNYEAPSEPYSPLYQSLNGSRSLIPDDLTEGDLQVVAILYRRTKTRALRARLGDVLWIRKRDHKVARAVIDDYTSVATTLMELNQWIEAIPLLRRAIQLGKVLGRKNEGWRLAERAFLSALAHPKANAVHSFNSALFAIAHDHGAGDPSELAVKARDHAKRANADRDFHRARSCHEHEAQFWKDLKNSANEEAANLASALTYPDEVQAHLCSPNPSFMLLADIAAKGVEALRRVKAPSDVISALRRQLTEFQQKSLGELQTFKSPRVDISKEVESVVEYMESPDLETALIKLALGFNLINVEEFKRETIEAANQTPLSFMLTGNIMDEKGRTTSKLGGLTFYAGEEFEKNLEAHMFHQAALFVWKHRVVARLDPARLKTWSDHLPTPNDFKFLVMNNPFIPPGHEGFFMRGLHYGLAGDFLLSSHLLTPQIENSMRYVLEQHGVDVSNLMEDLTQPVKLLGPIFDLPETKQIFGADMCFELRGHLIEKTGYAFRNQIAHGFLAEADCFSYAALSVWWLTLRLCFLGLNTPASRDGLPAAANGAPNGAI